MSFLRGIGKKSKSSRKLSDQPDGGSIPAPTSPLTKSTSIANHVHQDDPESMDGVLKKLSIASAIDSDAPDSPIITIEYPTPDVRYISKPPPLDLSITKRDSLGESHIPSSHSLDSLVSTPSRNSLG